MVELTVRLVLSLAVVIGLLLLLARFSSRRLRGRQDALVRVLHRQPLSRTSSVSVIAVGSRVLVLGTTEHQVSVLTELDPDELGLPVELAADLAPEVVAPTPIVPEVVGPSALAAREDDGPLAGSILSAATWRRAMAAATRQAS